MTRLLFQGDLLGPKAEYSLVIAHLLGVDHVGHSYSPSSPQMAGKLAQMDSLLRRVVREMDNGTLLMVLGDHGMTDSGNHGGSQPSETDTLLFAYYPPGLPTLPDAPAKQIDLVPTLAYLLGLHIPFCNLGKFIPAFYLGPGDPLGQVSRIYDANSQQILQYLQTLGKPEFSSLEEELRNMHRKYQTGQQIREEQETLIRKVQQVLLAQWSQLHYPLMILGLGVLIASFFWVCYLLRNHVSHPGAVAVVLGIRGWSLFSVSALRNEGTISLSL